MAFDAENLPLIYSIDSGSDDILSLFRLSSLDGKVYVLNPLDREHCDRYTFYAVASDDIHKSSRVKIVIHVLDLNDEIPRFIFPNANNDTLIIDRTYWKQNDYICQIDVEDLDQRPNHTLILVQNLNQLKNYDYIGDQDENFHFDSEKFFLDQQARVYYNSSNKSNLDEGVYYLAFKVS